MQISPRKGQSAVIRFVIAILLLTIIAAVLFFAIRANTKTLTDSSLFELAMGSLFGAAQTSFTTGPYHFVIGGAPTAVYMDLGSIEQPVSDKWSTPTGPIELRIAGHDVPWQVTPNFRYAEASFKDRNGKNNQQYGIPNPNNGIKNNPEIADPNIVGLLGATITDTEVSFPLLMLCDFDGIARETNTLGTLSCYARYDARLFEIDKNGVRKLIEQQPEWYDANMPSGSPTLPASRKPKLTALAEKYETTEGAINQDPEFRFLRPERQAYAHYDLANPQPPYTLTITAFEEEKEIPWNKKETIETDSGTVSKIIPSTALATVNYTQDIWIIPYSCADVFENKLKRDQINAEPISEQKKIGYMSCNLGTRSSACFGTEFYCWDRADPVYHGDLRKICCTKPKGTISVVPITPPLGKSADCVLLGTETNILFDIKTKDADPSSVTVCENFDNCPTPIPLTLQYAEGGYSRYAAKFNPSELGLTTLFLKFSIPEMTSSATVTQIHTYKVYASESECDDT